MSNKGPARDLTEGSCWRRILYFALPMLFGSLLQQLYNIVDSWVVGNYVGDSALAAVGVSFPVIFLFVSFFMGLGSGSTVVIAQSYGAGRMEDVKKTVDTAYATFLIIIVPLTVLFLLLVGPILHILNIDPAAYDDARLYMLIIVAGLIGNVGYNTNTAILQGLGNSRTPLLFLAISTVLNIILDLVSVLVLHMGVAGAAYATVIAQAASWLFGVFYINRKYPDIRIRLRALRLDRAIFREIMRIGLPSALQNATVSIGTMVVMGKVNSYGEVYTAAYNVGHKLDNVAFLPIQAISNAATAFVGQNIGAKKPERVKSGTRAVLLMALAWCLLVNLVLLPTRRFLVSQFTETAAVITAGAEYLFCILPFYPFFSLMFCLNSVIRGAGESVVPMLIAFVGQIFARAPGVILIANRFGPQYMYYGFAIGWILASGLSTAYYLSGRWKKKGLAKEP